MSGLWPHPRGLCDSLRPPACAPRVRRCRRDRPRLSGRVGLPDQQDRPLDAGAGGRTESASCGAGGRAARAGDSHPRLLTQHSTAVLGTGRGDLTPRRRGHQGGREVGRARGASHRRSGADMRQPERDTQGFRTRDPRRQRSAASQSDRTRPTHTAWNFYL